MLSEALMSRFRVWLLFVALLSSLAVGCGGGDSEKGVNKFKDRPKAADKGQ
jgi:hypothetical protein